MSSSRRHILAGGVLPVVLLLSACGSDSPGSGTDGASSAASGTSASGSTSGSPSASPSGVLDGVQIKEGAGASGAPELVLPKTPLTVQAPEHRIVKPGTGATITGLVARGEDRRWRLGGASRRSEVAVRECCDLGPCRHGPTHLNGE